MVSPCNFLLMHHGSRPMKIKNDTITQSLIVTERTRAEFECSQHSAHAMINFGFTVFDNSFRTGNRNVRQSGRANDKIFSPVFKLFNEIFPNIDS